MKTLLILTLAFGLFACSDTDKPVIQSNYTLQDSVLSERWKIIKALKDSIREGDLVVRCGNDYTSETLRDFSQKEKLYSHSGIAFMHDGEMYIYSNMAGDLNPDEVMRRDKADSFLTPVNNVAAGIYRYDLDSAEINRLKEIVINHYWNKLQFDMNFDLTTDNKMYCAEMIAKSIEGASNKRITFSKSEVSEDLRHKYLKMAINKKVIPSKKAAYQREYFAIDDLYLNKHCKEIVKKIFGEPQKPIMIPSPENDSL